MSLYSTDPEWKKIYSSLQREAGWKEMALAALLGVSVPELQAMDSQKLEESWSQVPSSEQKEALDALVEDMLRNPSEARMSVEPARSLSVGSATAFENPESVLDDVLDAHGFEDGVFNPQDGITVNMGVYRSTDSHNVGIAYGRTEEEAWEAASNVLKGDMAEEIDSYMQRSQTKSGYGIQIGAYPITFGRAIEFIKKKYPEVEIPSLVPGAEDTVILYLGVAVMASDVFPDKVKGPRTFNPENLDTWDPDLMKGEEF